VPITVGAGVRLRAPGAIAVAAALLAAALITWILTIERMGGMDAGPGTDLGGLGWFLGLWVTMMAAMMFPAAAPMVLVVNRVSDERGRGGPGALASTAGFVAGYLAVWTAYGGAVYGVYRALAAADPSALAWDREGPLVAGAAVAAAGIYELTPLKRACLRHCRSPLSFVLHRWRTGGAGAVVMGIEHGAWCLGCCIGLMLVLVILGVMSITWMAVVAGIIFAEKVLPGGQRVTVAVAAVLVAMGVWIASAPSTVPGLTEPGGTEMPMDPGMDMSRRTAGVPGLDAAVTAPRWVPLRSRRAGRRP
jgi:predicted metal-binding membrane protein